MKRVAKARRRGARRLWIVGVILVGLGAMGVVSSERGAPVAAVTEAQATGEYNTLYGVLQSLQAAAGEADFRVYLGTDYLYVQLKKGNESYFSVVPRNDYANLVLAMETKGGRG